MRPGDTRIKKRVLVGIVLKTIGLKGELKIRSLTDNPDRYRPGAVMWAAGAGGTGNTGGAGARAAGQPDTGRAEAVLEGPGRAEVVPSADVPLTVKSVRESGRDLAVFFEEAGSIEDAEALRGKELFVPESEVPPLPEGEYYHFQMLGLRVYTSRGRLLGMLSDIISAGARDVYVVKPVEPADRLRGTGREYLIPATDDAIEMIDMAGGRITLRPMKGYIPE